jgi:hypothetical protein
VNKSDGSDLNVDSIHLDECNVEDMGGVSDSSEEQINDINEYIGYENVSFPSFRFSFLSVCGFCSCV